MKLLVPILIIIFYFVGNVYVFHRIWAAMPPNLLGRVGLILFAVLVVLSLVLAFVAEGAMPVWLSTFCYRLGTDWFFILLFMFIVFLFQDLLGLANRFLHFMPSDALTRYTRENWVGLGFIVGFVALFMFCGFLKYRWKVKVPVDITLDKTIGDSIYNKDTLRIVAISDLHLGYGISKSEFESWIEIINKEEPDVIIIAGDIVDNSTKPLIENGYAESFGKFKAPMGVYACLGNHEYLSGIDASMEFLAQTNITVLRDSVALIDNAFYIVGRDDLMNSRRKPLSHLVEDLDQTKPIILLDHQPFKLEQAEKNNIDIQFSGHTHQGQVWPVSMVTGQLFELDHGHKKKGKTNIVVSSGIGIWGGKFRIGTQSEYVVINVKGKE